VSIPGVAISARAMRDRVRAGRSLRYLTPPADQRYIESRGLYRESTDPLTPSPSP